MRAATMETKNALHLSLKWLKKEICELTVVLDKDIENLKRNLSRLDELRSLTVKRDEKALGNLLTTIQTETNNHGANEVKRGRIRKELAAAFKCEPGQMTLSLLETILPEELKTEISIRKIQLQDLTVKLKKEHSNTTMLLTECARINSMLLKTIFDSNNRESVVYNAKGSTKRQNNTKFVDMQF
ncbi:MAG: hypothetical protein ACYTBP_06665 [Planctomycetota bacterium]|jgi:hypothetical protein